MKLLILLLLTATLCAAEKPNIILVMADDQGWGETGYYDHPVLKTPNLDAMAAAGLRFDRFYAGAPVCSPTRASVLTGRSNERTGVMSHGYPLRLQEKTLPAALRKAGYATGHFGKWHLNGLRGPGAPILPFDDHHPGAFGFDEWLSVTNFFDRNPLMSRMGEIEEFKGDSSEIIVEEALKFIGKQARAEKPFFTVIWYGTPHSPWMASDEDRKPFKQLDEKAQHHYGELVALDRSIGALRKGLRKLKIADNTLFWYCSDNGGLPGFKPTTVGNLRGFKGSVFEGGLRVPAIIEWPAGIKKPRVTSHPSATMDIFPTIAGIVGLPEASMLDPVDGMDLRPVIAGADAPRKKPIGFRCLKRAAWIDNNHKLLIQKAGSGNYELYDLAKDASESEDLSAKDPELLERMRKGFEKWSTGMDASLAGKDYPGGKVNAGEPEPRFWRDVPEYQPYLEEWGKRPEYKSVSKSKGKRKK